MSVNYSRFIESLYLQLTYVKNSCSLFDEGNYYEAIRIATSIRVIVHDTKNSVSLLSHLGANNIKILSTVSPVEDAEYLTLYDGVSYFNTGPEGGLFPLLNTSNYNHEVTFDEWWNQLLVVSEGSYRLTRKSLVLTASNKDGGAHVDNMLPSDYEALRNGICTITHIMADGTTEVGFNKIHLIALRQMGYEILHSTDLLRLAGC